jgi:4a-hydroxytetrahydrobiopterin dehydratase
MDLADKGCIPCQGGVPPMTRQEAWKKISDIPGWELGDDGRRIQRRYTFHDFLTPWRFADRIAEIAETQGHHPDVCFGWGYCTVSLQTHDINGLHENDFIMAAKINEMSRETMFAEALRT